MTDNRGNALGVVATVYTAILIPLGFLYLHDFLSDRWRTIRHTFIDGLLHLIFASLPLSYIVYYAYLQAALTDPDYKELFAAVTAIVLSVYHILRTLWGLYQLYRFREWAVQVAVGFESAGYVTTFSSAYGTPDDDGRLGRWFSTIKNTLDKLTSKTRFRSSTPKTTQNIPSDAISVRRSCFTHHRARPPKMETEESLKRIRYTVNHMLVNATIIDNEFINSYAPFSLFWKLKPLHTNMLFVRWSVLYMCTFGEEFVNNCIMKSFGNSSWDQRRWNMASTVWATAALRMETKCRFGEADPLAGSNVGARSFLDPAQWDKVTQSDDDQVFNKEFVLRKCFSSGQRLPYECPIIDSFDDNLPSTNLYRPLIKDAVESLPTKFFDLADKITALHIEWFAVFLEVHHWGGCIPDLRASNMSSDSLGSKGSRRKPQTKSRQRISSDTPVKVLQDQLGFESPATLERSAFPFHGARYGRKLWANRSVLQVSARIDNWIALCAGGQLAFLLSIEKDLHPDGKLFKEHHKPREGVLENQDAFLKDPEFVNKERSRAIVNFHELVETKRLRYQLANPRPFHCHLEIGLTFMGCIMESTRSAIAETLNMTGQISTWCPLIPEEPVSFKISKELNNCLLKVHSGKRETRIRFDSTIQERLLWECQNGVHYSWKEKMDQAEKEVRRPPAAPETIECMVLCILGFPGLKVVHKICNEDSEDLGPHLVYEIWPVAGPQLLRALILVDWRREVATARIKSTAVPDSQNPTALLKFRWQDWRDAFEGRLAGKCHWQKSHHMKELYLRPTSHSIAAGVTSMLIGEDDGERLIPMFRRYLVWDGWRPFRAGMTLFELRHSSLIVIGDEMPNDIGYNESESSDITVEARTVRDAYSRATMSALTDASEYLDALLTLNRNVFRKPEDLTQEVDDAPMTEFVDFTPAHASSSSSSDSVSFRLVANLDPPLPNKILQRAQEQNSGAMHVLSVWVLKGKMNFKKDYFKAIQLMERALVLGRNIKTAELLVRTLLDHSIAPEGTIDVDRALSSIELMWRDIVARHETITIGKKRIRRWRSNSEAEIARMARLVKLNLAIIDVRPEAKLMRNLADRLSMWGDSKEDEISARLLYEAAILAELDGKSMLELGHRNKRDNPRFATALYKRALISGQQDAAKPLCEMIRNGAYVDVDVDELVEVYEMASAAGHTIAMQELIWLIRRKANGVYPDRLRNQMMMDKQVYGSSVVRVSQDATSGDNFMTSESQEDKSENLKLSNSRDDAEDLV